MNKLEQLAESAYCAYTRRDRSWYDLTGNEQDLWKKVATAVIEEYGRLKMTAALEE